MLKFKKLIFWIIFPSLSSMSRSGIFLTFKKRASFLGNPVCPPYILLRFSALATFWRPIAVEQPGACDETHDFPPRKLNFQMKNVGVAKILKIHKYLKITILVNILYEGARVKKLAFSQWVLPVAIKYLSPQCVI